jgi:hypothetical protein
MIGRVIRVFVGYALACLAAGATVVLFVYTPIELMDLDSQRISEAGLMALFAATHSAKFAWPFALIGAVLGEWRRIGSWLYYVLAAALIAAIGFAAQFWSEAAGEATIVNRYAVTAFVLTGLVAGTVYWLAAGRSAADSGPAEPEILPPPRSAAKPDAQVAI